MLQLISLLSGTATKWKPWAWLQNKDDKQSKTIFRKVSGGADRQRHHRYLGMSRYVSVFLSMSRYVSVCLSMSQYVLVCLSMSQYVSVCLSMSRYVSVCPAGSLWRKQNLRRAGLSWATWPSVHKQLSRNVWDLIIHDIFKLQITTSLALCKFWRRLIVYSLRMFGLPWKRERTLTLSSSSKHLTLIPFFCV